MKITRTARNRVRLRRAGIVPASAQGRSAADAAGMFAATAQYVRQVLHAFNEQGFAASDPKWSGVGHRSSAPRSVSSASRCVRGCYR
ncbi:helix-turn-helix domain-containing protein [Streptomyces sp. NPDC102278]|uniref:helix-turn-helix domain-containing protein n=1 Tax=Streptomyces sp. NPDC102278 TaxID=3366152 RepID=UPI00381A09BC